MTYKVLIIDDEPWSRQVVKALADWERLGLELAGEAEDGRDGIRRIEALRPDIVVTDMRMPGLDGVELLRTLGERYPKLKLVVMSGYDDFVYLKQAIRSRAIEYLLKPVDPEELNAALAQCVRELSAGPDGEWLAGLIQRVADGLRKRDKQEALRELERLAAWLAANESAPSGDRWPAEAAVDLERHLRAFYAEIGGTADGWAALAGPLPIGAMSAAALAEDAERLIAGVFEAAEAEDRLRHRLDLAAVRGYIEDHYAEPLTLESVAHRFYVSKEHLSRVFKPFAGETVTDFIVRQRMEKARALILERKLAIKDAAALVGYPDVAYFYRVFKKFYGATPGDLRGDD